MRRAALAVLAALGLAMGGVPAHAGAREEPPDAQVLLDLDMLKEADLARDRDLYRAMGVLERLRMLEALRFFEAAPPPPETVPVTPAPRKAGPTR